MRPEIKTMPYRGTIIEESLESPDVLAHARILGTRVETVTPRHATPWLDKWTLHTVEIADADAQGFAREISRVLDYSHGSAWYADFKSPEWHYIIFKDRIFKVARPDAAGYREAKEYGMALGIPERQVDFSPDIE